MNAWKTVLLITVVGLLATVTIAGADLQIALDSYEFDSDSNLWEYSYAIDNSTGANYVYYIELDPVDMATITGFPTGWGDVFGQTSIDGWASWGAETDGDWLAPGGTLTGFLLESPYSPSSGYTRWGAVTDSSPTGGGDTDFVTGRTTGPQVPEPATMLLFACGVAGLAARRFRRQS